MYYNMFVFLCAWSVSGNGVHVIWISCEVVPTISCVVISLPLWEVPLRLVADKELGGVCTTFQMRSSFEIMYERRTSTCNCWDPGYWVAMPGVPCMCSLVIKASLRVTLYGESTYAWCTSYNSDLLVDDMKRMKLFDWRKIGGKYGQGTLLPRPQMAPCFLS